MKLLIYFFLLVVLWVTFIPAVGALERAPSALFLWFVTINIVVTVKLLIDIHVSRRL